MKHKLLNPKKASQWGITGAMKNTIKNVFDDKKIDLVKQKRDEFVNDYFDSTIPRNNIDK